MCELAENVMDEANAPTARGPTNTDSKVSEVEPYESETENEHTNDSKGKEKGVKKRPTLLRRLSSIRSLRPSIRKVRRGFQKFSCVKREDPDEDEELPFASPPGASVPRHKSFDIGVGLARRMSLFIFTKKASSVHPYHPYYPKQTTRKIYLIHEEKH